MNQTESNQRAEWLINKLVDLPVHDALSVLQIVMGKILDRSAASGDTDLSERMSCAVIRLRRGRHSVIDQDDEIRAYIHTFTARDTIPAIAKACKERFGVERAPSKGSIGRYLRNLKYRANRRGKSS